MSERETKSNDLYSKQNETEDYNLYSKKNEIDDLLKGFRFLNNSNLIKDMGNNKYISYNPFFLDNEYFVKNGKQQIQSHYLFNFIKNMPKGVLHHAHLFAFIDLIYIIRFIIVNQRNWSDKLCICMNPNSKNFLCLYMLPITDYETKFPIKDFKDEETKQKEKKNIIESNIRKKEEQKKKEQEKEEHKKKDKEIKQKTDQNKYKNPINDADKEKFKNNKDIYKDDYDYIYDFVSFVNNYKNILSDNTILTKIFENYIDVTIPKRTDETQIRFFKDTEISYNREPILKNIINLFVFSDISLKIWNRRNNLLKKPLYNKWDLLNIFTEINGNLSKYYKVFPYFFSRVLFNAYFDKYQIIELRSPLGSIYKFDDKGNKIKIGYKTGDKKEEKLNQSLIQYDIMMYVCLLNNMYIDKHKHFKSDNFPSMSGRIGTNINLSSVDRIESGNTFIDPNIKDFNKESNEIATYISKFIDEAQGKTKEEVFNNNFSNSSSSSNYNPDDYTQIYKGVYYIDFTIINATSRGSITTKLDKTIIEDLMINTETIYDNIRDNYKKYEKINENNVNRITGVDLYGEEDYQYDIYTIEDIIKKYYEKFKYKNIKFYFHAGEQHKLDNADKNLKLSIKYAKRIGHGLRLFDNKKLRNECIHNNICIEICPISNNLLDYTPNLSYHPAILFMRDNIPISISSDDQFLYGYSSIAYDWTAAILLWNLKIKNIEKILYDSFKYSTYPHKYIEKYIKIFTDKWVKWINNYNNYFKDENLKEYNELFRLLKEKDNKDENNKLQEELNKYKDKFANENIKDFGYSLLNTQFKKYIKYKNKYLLAKSKYKN